MSALDWLVLAAVAAWLIIALRALVREKKSPCGGCCAHCSAACGRRQ